VRIALVTGHYIPRLGYMEVHLSKAFALLGHDVHVFTTNRFPSYLKHERGDFGNAPKGVQVSRLRPFFSLGQIVRARGLRAKVKAYSPDLIIVIGLGKWFPKPVFSLKTPIYTLLGDNAYSYASASWKSKLLFNLFKRSTYEKALKVSDRLFTYTPETREVVLSMMGNSFRESLNQSTEIFLGYWSSEFFFDQKIRNQWRARLGYGQDDKVVITATRVVPEKKLEDQTEFFKNAEKNVKWLILGASDSSYSQELEKKLASSLSRERFMLLPYASRSELNNYYNAADLALFTVPAISVFEALGAGLKLRIPKVKSLQLVSEENFRSCLTDEPFDLKDFEYSRDKTMLMTKSQFAWENIAARILAEK
jgi:glycosyltransferase involved in cell wall biosynthesis